MSFSPNTLPDLKKLRHAVTLADTGSFSQASRQLHLSQPALTRSIQALEAQLGLTLFDRHSGPVVTTPQGAVLLEQARQLLRQANGLTWEAVLLRDGEAGSVNFGIGPMLTPSLPATITAIQDARPRLQLRVEIKPAWQLMELLLDEKLEFCIADLGSLASTPALETQPIAAQPNAYFVRHDHPLALQPTTRSGDLAAYPLATTGYQNAMGAEPNSYHADHEPRGLLSCEDLTTLKWAALYGDTVLLGSAWALQGELTAGQLVQLHFVDTPSQWQSDVRLARLAGRSLSPAADLVIDCIREQLQPRSSPQRNAVT